MSPRDETLVRGWCLALRDLCDQGAVAASVTLEGAEVPSTIVYTPGKGALVVAGERRLSVPESALDDHGLVLAGGAALNSMEAHDA